MQFMKYFCKIFLLLLIAKPLLAELSQDANQCIELTKTHHSFQYQSELKPEEARVVCENAFTNNPENLEVRFGLEIYFELGLFEKEHEQLNYLYNRAR